MSSRRSWSGLRWTTATRTAANVNVVTTMSRGAAWTIRVTGPGSRKDSP